MSDLGIVGLKFHINPTTVLRQVHGPVEVHSKYSSLLSQKSKTVIFEVTIDLLDEQKPLRSKLEANMEYC